jgi:hypothetical protein
MKHPRSYEKPMTTEKNINFIENEKNPSKRSRDSSSQSIEEVFQNESHLGHCHLDHECNANPQSSRKLLEPRNRHNSREEIFISLIFPA